MKYLYTKADGRKLIRDLRHHYGGKAELKGTLPSNHDIDVRVEVPQRVASVTNEDRISRELKDFLRADRMIKTDMGHYFYKSSDYGHVDIRIVIIYD